MTNKFVSVMEAIGRDALKGLKDIEPYLPGAAVLAGLLFPAETATITSVVSATQLVQNAIVLVEQKMAAGGQATGTGLQKSADVLATVEPTVLQLLGQAGVDTSDTSYVQKIIDAVVADLNVRDSTVTTAPAS